VTFDSLALAAVRNELECELLGGQIQGIVPVGPLVLGLECYARGQKRFLLCSAEPLAARVCLVTDRPLRDTGNLTPFLLLLRKHVRHGRLTGVQQPSYERVLKLRIAKRDRKGIPSEIQLIIESMGRRSNALLVSPDGRILDALRRAGPSLNPVRPILPNLVYVAPPPQDRLDPLQEASYAELRSASAENMAVALEDVLATRLAGFSPLVAREAAFRAVGRRGAPASEADWRAVQATVLDLLSPLSSHRWEPSVCFQEGRLTAFAPYRLTHLGEHDVQVVPSISRAIEMAFAVPVRPRAAQQDGRALLAAIDRLRRQLERKRDALRRTLEASARAAVLKEAGQSVLANLASLEPGSRDLKFNGHEIQLDPQLSPLQNAQRLFREYRKARDAARQVPRLMADTELRLRQLDQLRALAEVADSPARIRSLSEELAELAANHKHKTANDGSVAKRRSSGVDRRSSEGHVLRSRTPDGLEVLVGTSGRGNQLVTFKLADPDDLWLHARGVAGAHVVLRAAGREPPSQSIEHAAVLAALNSRARSAGRVEVDYTRRRHVRKTRRASPGLVTYSREKTVAVDPGQ
jgi:predicted ribosome quality control (RQC) complex YloA/Tae2 family protein